MHEFYSDKFLDTNSACCDLYRRKKNKAATTKPDITINSI